MYLTVQLNQKSLYPQISAQSYGKRPTFFVACDHEASPDRDTLNLGITIGFVRLLVNNLVITGIGAILDALSLSIMEPRCGPADPPAVIASLPRWCHGS